MEPKQAVPELLDNQGKKGWGGEMRRLAAWALGLSHPPQPAEAPLRPQAVSHPPSFVLQLKSGPKMFTEQSYCF